MHIFSIKNTVGFQQHISIILGKAAQRDANKNKR